jgi:hypothetical protein
MSAPLAHLHALAQRTLDAHERRAGELRARLAPVLAASVAGAVLLSPPALAAVHSGGPLSTAAFLLTVALALVTVISMGRFLGRRLHAERMQPDRIRHLLEAHDALDDESSFHHAMTMIFGKACGIAAREADALHRQFTAIMWGILVVLCGLALTAVVAW